MHLITEQTPTPPIETHNKLINRWNPAQRDCAANFASEFTAQPAPEEHVEVGGW